MADALRYAGADAREFPTIRIEDPESLEPLETAVAQVADYDWLVLTSVNGVERFFAELGRQAADARRLGPVRIATIGPATTAALARYGLCADVTPEEFRGEGVAEVILAQHDGHLHGLSVLLPRAAVARSALPDALRQAGARVDVVPAYRTLAASDETQASLRAAFARAEFDVATFTSPSTVHNTVAALGQGAIEQINRLTVAAIGPITRQAAERLGIRVDVSATEYTIEGLIGSLERHFGGDHAS
jgi:uroporphyrinogen III methyltransferase/synthase